MKWYTNSHGKKTKRSFTLLIACNYCKRELFQYQKVGKGNLLRIYLRRIISSTWPLNQIQGQFSCPWCGENLGQWVEEPGGSPFIRVGRACLTWQRLD